MSAALVYPAAAAPDMRRLFGEVIGIKELSAVQGIINLLHEGQQLTNSRGHISRFTDEAYKLPALTISPTDVRVGKISVPLKPQTDSGTFGTCFKTETGNQVYKQILINAEEAKAGGRIRAGQEADYIEAKVRSVYVEAFIQTVLASDPDVGHFVTRPLHLYKSASMRRPGAGSGDSGTIELYIHMDVNKFKFEEWMTELQRRKGNELAVVDIEPLWSQIAAALDVLRKKYNFYHGDLHCGNVMVDGKGNLKIIDFGMSCLTYEDLLYRTVDHDEIGTKMCYDNDILIHVLSFLEFGSRHHFIESERTKIKSLLNYEGDNFYNNCAAVAATEGGSIFHQGYDWLMAPVLKRIYRPLKRGELQYMDKPLLFGIKIRELAGVYTAISGFAAAPCNAPGGCAIMGGRRRKTRRRRSRRAYARRH